MPDDKGISLTRAGFRAAVAEIEAYAADSPDRTPAFLLPTRYLPRRRRSPLPELSGAPPADAGVRLGLAQAVRCMTDGSLTAVALARQCLEAVSRRDRELNAFVHVLPPDRWLAQAEALDQERRAGKVRGPLHGIPISVKDVIAVAGMPYTASSRVLAGNIAPVDAPAVAKLRRAGAIITGKTQTHEFALGVTTPQSRNPWDGARDPGGSSGGSAISVVTGMSLGSLGTDTRASTRVPAALCGVVGLKPTFGLAPAQGIINLSWSLDHLGLLASGVEDAATLLNVVAGPGRDRDYTRHLRRDLAGLRVAVPAAALDGADPEVLRAFNDAIQALVHQGVNIETIGAPDAQDFSRCNSMGLVVSRCEAANYHQSLWQSLRRDFNTDPSLYTRPVFEQLEEAARVPAVVYLQAQRYREEFRQRMRELLGRNDALLMPTCRVPAPKSDDVERFFLVLSMNCIPWSFIGFPAISVPCGVTAAGLPVGAQLVAGPLEDARLLSLAAGLERGLAG
ncbi:MAG: amidase [Dehalococcoidia bacterium]|nr:amidase [Dehalococcoidia bacterium]MSQ17639.1 amidase [Dehalococcoidia bacterium]